MNTKLKKISFKLSKKFKLNTLNETFKNFMRLVYSQKDYFIVYKTDELVKITLYIYSLNQTGKYDLGDSMISNCYVGNYFEFEDNDFYTEECENCNGNGYDNCETCDGTGEVECSNCDSEGEVTCAECDGSGEDGEGYACEECNGRGVTDCDECDSSGKYSCSNCGGDGSNTCHECDGKGEIETDRVNYYQTTFLVWDKELINMFINSYELDRPMAIQKIFPLENEDLMVVLTEEQENAEFKENVKPDKKYCYYLEKLKSNSLLQIGEKLVTPVDPDQYEL